MLKKIVCLLLAVVMVLSMAACGKKEPEKAKEYDGAALMQALLDQVKIDTSLPCEQRIKKFVEQIGNPYCYLDGDVVVSLGFSDTGVCLKDQLKALASNIG